MPHQAVLVDLARRFYFFFIEIWPQEVYYMTGLLILGSRVAISRDRVVGRVWCGYLCPQTVWTDLFVTMESSIEGDRRPHLLRVAAMQIRTRAQRGLNMVDSTRVVDRRRVGVLFRGCADAGQKFVTFGLLRRLCVIGVLTFTTYSLAG